MAVFAPLTTFVILIALKLVFGSLRVAEEDEFEGLDLAEHSESAYAIGGGSSLAVPAPAAAGAESIAAGGACALDDQVDQVRSHGPAVTAAVAAGFVQPRPEHEPVRRRDHMLRVIRNMRSGLAGTLVASAFCLLALAPAIATAQGGEKADPSIEERIADLEAYVNNTGRAADAADARLVEGLGRRTGPQRLDDGLRGARAVHDAAGSGALLRRTGAQEESLSVLAQCLGIAGLVTILWWAFGYSLVFAAGGALLGSMQFVFLKGVDSLPNTDTRTGSRITCSRCTS